MACSCLLFILACLVQCASKQVLIVVGTTAITANDKTNQCIDTGVQTVNDTSKFGGWIRNCKSGSSGPTEGDVDSTEEPVAPKVVIVIGSTVFSNSETLEECMERLSPGVANAGSEIKECVGKPETTPTPGGLPDPSGGMKYTRKEGETVTFECKVSGMRKNDIFGWKMPRRDDYFAYQKQGDQEITYADDEYYSFSSSNTTDWKMTINTIRRRDAGVHRCVVHSVGNDEYQSENFTLNVTYPVEINGVTPNDPPHVRQDAPNVLYFNETDNATIVCLSDGNPPPQTFWRRWDSSSNLPSGAKLSLGRILNIYNIIVEDEGIYTCESRQIINPAMFNVTIRVQHKPITEETGSILKKLKGSSVELVCNIDSEPLPVMAAWYKDQDRITIGTKTTRHRSSLFITNLVPSRDYHNYTCVVSNALGSSSCYFEVTGRPSRPTIISPNKSNRRNSYTLEWTYEDYDIVNRKEFQIYFTQKKAMPVKYVAMRRESPELLFNPRKPMHYNLTIHDLRPNSTYYVELSALNEYGQGDVETFEFRTPAADKKKPRNPEIRLPLNAGRLVSPSLPLAIISVSLCVGTLLHWT